jgi:hypothetical protein
MYKSLPTTVSPTPGADYKTIGELLEKVPKAKEPVTVTMKSTIKNVKDAFKSNREIDNLVVVTDSLKKEPMGVLYKDDFRDAVEANIDKEEDIDNLPLGDRIKKITNDMATGKSWTQEKGCDNYAELSESDTLEQAEAKMVQVGGEYNNMIRGLVLHSPDQRTIIGIVEYSMIGRDAFKKG